MTHFLRWNDFPRSLVFAAVAAAGFAPFALLAAPWLDAAQSLVAYALVLVPGYLVGIGGSPRGGLGAALLAAVPCFAIALLAPAPREGIIAAAAVLALGRSGLVHRRPVARAVVIETLLLLAGLGVAKLLIGGSTLSVVLAIWGYFLVQSAYFLVGGSRSERARAEGDPFERARDRALEILDG